MKISIIGVGSVGQAIATAVKNTGLAHEIVLFDIDGVRARAAAEDLGHASAFSYDVKITAANNYRAIHGSEIVIISAGANQKPGETRMDLLNKNATVIRDVVPKIMVNVDSKTVKLVIVTNPLDVMVMLAQKLSKLPTSRVIGTGTMLDSARLRVLLARTLSVSPQSVNAYVLGEHGDSSVIAWKSATIGAIELNDFCVQTKTPMTENTRATIEHRVKTAAYEIIRGRGATWDGIAGAVADLVRCIANDENRILTVSTVAGVGKNSVAVSMPRIVGNMGVKTMLVPQMDNNEISALQHSATIIRKNYDLIAK